MVTELNRLLCKICAIYLAYQQKYHTYLRVIAVVSSQVYCTDGSHDTL